MDFLRIDDEAERETLRKMHGLMLNWSNFYRDKPRRNVSIMYIVEQELPYWRKKRRTSREGMTTGEPTPKPMDYTKGLRADRIQKILDDRDIWAGRWRAREILIKYYLSPFCPDGRIARKLSIPGDRLTARTLGHRVQKTLLFLSTIWRDV